MTPPKKTVGTVGTVAPSVSGTVSRSLGKPTTRLGKPNVAGTIRGHWATGPTQPEYGLSRTAIAEKQVIWNSTTSAAAPKESEEK